MGRSWVVTCVRSQRVTGCDVISPPPPSDFVTTRVGSYSLSSVPPRSWPLHQLCSQGHLPSSASGCCCVSSSVSVFPCPSCLALFSLFCHCVFCQSPLCSLWPWGHFPSAHSAPWWTVLAVHLSPQPFALGWGGWWLGVACSDPMPPGRL